MNLTKISRIYTELFTVTFARLWIINRTESNDGSLEEVV